ncbi:hypothetical protein M0D69_33575 [Caballeronia sp. SEWSISQ10-4 2]|uniref:hypothetical protein n=1 Tax=Caballeronia sp. SEWSISQ10-4 2 TaxID=2937438 RepID=UPI002654D38C|nr:hypothetical protein [Caballeronia sp. SEWSISQ10-4 2]MDN7182858.1 hypothetical protein [Caballeronia sp. SEWSISQ10-4 2]
MSDTTQDHYDNLSYPLVSPDGAEAELDPQQVLYAHLMGLCFGALIIFGATAAVCAAVRWL